LTARGISGAKKKDFFFIHNKLPLISLSICIKSLLQFFNDYFYIITLLVILILLKKKGQVPFYYILSRAETVLFLSEKGAWELGTVAWKRGLAPFLCYHFLPPFFYSNFGNLDNL